MPNFLIAAILILTAVFPAGASEDDAELWTPAQYNYKAYHGRMDWGLGNFRIKRDPFPDGKVFDLEAKKWVHFKDLLGKRPVVVESGSVTCPAFDVNVDPMNKVIRDFAGKVDFYTLYVRENHPLGKYPAHETMEQKIKHAEDLDAKMSVQSKILVDTVEGTLHQRLGNYGNAVWLIGVDRHVSHFNLFNDPHSLRTAINELLAEKGKAAKTPFSVGEGLYPVKREHPERFKIMSDLFMKNRMGKTEDPSKMPFHLKRLTDQAVDRAVVERMEKALK